MDGISTAISYADVEALAGGHEGLDRGYVPPIQGLLVRTVIPSPVIRWIIPARIRHKNKNDVVFISNNSIEVKEYVGDCLRKVIVKDDFGSSIRAAKVIGTPPRRLIAERPSGLHEIIKKEVTETSTDSMDVEGVAGPEVPPQILVLATESDSRDNLLFLFAFYDLADRIRFLSFQHPLPYHERYAERLGRHIAIDPRSRAMAVAALSGSFIVYTLKTMARLRQEVESSTGLHHDKFVPIISERHMRLDGIILKMEFLYPSRNDEHHVILLVVFSMGDGTKLRVYDWDCSKDLWSIEQGNDFKVGPHQQCPLLLIPFTINTGFILVSEDWMAVYHNILTGNMSPYCVQLDHNDIKEPGSSRKNPLFTSWARPTRREDWSLQNDVFYLCREDGLVRFLEFQRGHLPMWVKFEVGGISVNIDTAFAVLDIGIGKYHVGGRSYDMLVAAGDMSDGILVQFEARKWPEPLQSIPNWAPVIDCCIAQVSSDLDSDATRLSIPYESQHQVRERLFGCFGRGKDHGAIGEIQSGVEANSRIYYEVNGGITGTWILPDVSGSSTSICVLMTDPENMTTLLRIQNDSFDAESIMDLEHLCGIDIDCVTLAAGSTLGDIIVQVTNLSVRALSPTLGCRFIHTFETETAKLAHIEGRSSAILMAMDTNVLHYGELSINNSDIVFDRGNGPGLTFRLSSECSCVYLAKVGQCMYAFVGTTTGQLHLFDIDHEAGFNLMLTHEFVGEFAICDSIAVISRNTEIGAHPRMAVVCGLRNGSIHNFFFDIAPDDNLTLELIEMLSLGSTTVTVKSDASSCFGPEHFCSRAIVSCAENFCRLCYRPSQWGSYRAVIQSIWLTALNELDFKQSSIMCFAQSDPWIFDRDNISGMLICIDNSRLHLTELDYGLQTSPIVQRMSVPGTPSRITFSRLINKLVVAFTTIKIRESRDNKGKKQSQKRRLLYPTLMFIDPNERYPQHHRDQQLDASDLSTSTSQRLPLGVPKVIGPSGMKILGLTEWTPSVLGKSFPLLVVNTLRARRGDRDKTGTIQIYNIARAAPDIMIIDLKHNIPCDKPVYSLASYGACSLVFCSGTTLCLRTMEAVDGVPRWVITATYELRTTALHISVREPYIYLSTNTNSVMVFKVVETSLVPQISDISGRPGLHHLLIPFSSLLLATTMEKTVVGLRHSLTLPLNNSSHTVFEVVLPGTIRKLYRGNIRPPWLTTPEGSLTVVIGSSMDGSFHQFEVIDPDTWRLLRFIQNMAERNETICPHTYAEPPQLHIEPVPTEKYMDINGELLYRLLDRGTPDTATLLRAILEVTPDSVRRGYDFDTWQARQKRFFEIFDVLVKTGSQDRIEAVVDFLRETLQPVL